MYSIICVLSLPDHYNAIKKSFKDLSKPVLRLVNGPVGLLYYNATQLFTAQRIDQLAAR